jgi:hypothetical protein
VGDEDSRAALHDSLEAGEDLFFGVGVYGGQCVVEDEDAGVADYGSGYGGALLLAAGEGETALAYHGVEAAGEFEDLVSDVGDGGGFFDLLVGGGGNSEGYVVADGVGEEVGLLGDEADVLTETLEGDGADGSVVDQDTAGGGVEQAGDEVYEGGFSGAGGAYDGETASGGDVEVDVAENVGTGGVGEG